MTEDLGERMSDMHVLCERQQASFSSAGTAEEPPKLPAKRQTLDASARVHSTIRGLAVFGPLPRQA
eukprot:2609340-Pleurochrysis_carterae.AAC.1